VFSQQAARWLDRHNIHYAWLVVSLTFLTMLISAAALGLPGALLQPLTGEFGWTAGEVSSAFAVRFALYGLLGPFAAILIERYGMRLIVFSALALLASGLLLATRMTALWQFFLLWGVVLGTGSGLTALVLGATVANRWFEQRRGLVLGILTASTATGQLLFLPLAAYLIRNFGWRIAVLPVLGGCVIVAVLVFLFLRERPEDLGLTPFGANARVPRPAGPAWRPDFLEPIRALAGAAGNRTFWLLAATFFICGLSTSGLIQTHFISLCSDYGVAALPAASVLAMMGAFDFIGTIASGWLSDRFDNRKLLFWYYGLRGLSLLWLPNSGFTWIGLTMFAMFYGLDWIATVPPTVKLANAAFDRQRGAMIFGWIFAAHQLGGALAAYGAGLTRTVLLSYSPALYAAGASCLVAAAIVFLIPPGSSAARLRRVATAPA